MGLLFINTKPNWVLHQVKPLGGLILVRPYPTCFTLHLMSRSKNVRPLMPHDLSMVTVIRWLEPASEGGHAQNSRPDVAHRRSLVF
jgi:hypothetical protein